MCIPIFFFFARFYTKHLAVHNKFNSMAEQYPWTHEFQKFDDCQGEKKLVTKREGIKCPPWNCLLRRVLWNHYLIHSMYPASSPRLHGSFDVTRIIQKSSMGNRVMHRPFSSRIGEKGHDRRKKTGRGVVGRNSIQRFTTRIVSLKGTE